MRMRRLSVSTVVAFVVLRGIACLPDDGAYPVRFDAAPDPDGAVTPTDGGATDAGATDGSAKDGTSDGGATDGSADGDADARPSDPSLGIGSASSAVHGRVAGIAIFPLEAVARASRDDAGATIVRITLAEWKGSCGPDASTRPCGTNELTFAFTPETVGGGIVPKSYALLSPTITSSDDKCSVSSASFTTLPGGVVDVTTSDGTILAGTFGFDVFEGGRIRGRFSAPICK